MTDERLINDDLLMIRGFDDARMDNAGCKVAIATENCDTPIIEKKFQFFAHNSVENINFCFYI